MYMDFYDVRNFHNGAIIFFLTIDDETLFSCCVCSWVVKQQLSFCSTCKIQRLKECVKTKNRRPMLPM